MPDWGYKGPSISSTEVEKCSDIENEEERRIKQTYGTCVAGGRRKSRRMRKGRKSSKGRRRSSRRTRRR
jgi:hypothetical protein